MKNKIKIFLVSLSALGIGFLGMEEAMAVEPCKCGNASGRSSSSAPASELCSVGAASAVSPQADMDSGKIFWTWACEGEGCENRAVCFAEKVSSPPAGLIIPDELAGLPTNPGLVKGIVSNIADWLLSIIGIIAIISFVISGFQYFLVASDDKMMEKAKKTMVASIIGLIVALSGFIAIKMVDVLLRASL
jgi:hypothetical protein